MNHVKRFNHVLWGRSVTVVLAKLLKDTALNDTSNDEQTTMRRSLTCRHSKETSRREWAMPLVQTVWSEAAVRLAMAKGPRSVRRQPVRRVLSARLRNPAAYR